LGACGAVLVAIGTFFHNSKQRPNLKACPI
jgi:hypothetical protein